MIVEKRKDNYCSFTWSIIMLTGSKFGKLATPSPIPSWNDAVRFNTTVMGNWERNSSRTSEGGGCFSNPIKCDYQLEGLSDSRWMGPPPYYMYNLITCKISQSVCLIDCNCIACLGATVVWLQVELTVLSPSRALSPGGCQNDLPKSRYYTLILLLLPRLLPAPLFFFFWRRFFILKRIKDWILWNPRRKMIFRVERR